MGILKVGVVATAGEVWSWGSGSVEEKVSEKSVFIRVAAYLAP